MRKVFNENRLAHFPNAIYMSCFFIEIRSMTLFRMDSNARLRKNTSLKSFDKCGNKSKMRKKDENLDCTLQQLMEVHLKWKVKHNQSINGKFRRRNRRNGVSSIKAVGNWRWWRRICSRYWKSQCHCLGWNMPCSATARTAPHEEIIALCVRTLTRNVYVT